MPATNSLAYFDLGLIIAIKKSEIVGLTNQLKIELGFVYFQKSLTVTQQFLSFRANETLF